MMKCTYQLIIAVRYDGPVCYICSEGTLMGSVSGEVTDALYCELNIKMKRLSDAPYFSMIPQIRSIYVCKVVRVHC